MEIRITARTHEDMQFFIHNNRDNTNYTQLILPDTLVVTDTYL